MACLLVLIDESVTLAKLDSYPKQSLTWNGVVYMKRSIPDEEVVFYDWIIAEANAVRALEIHLAPDHPLLRSRVPLSLVSNVELDCFVRIWFHTDRTGTAQGLEAFGDIGFYGSDASGLAIAVDLDHWLQPTQRDSLLALL